MRFRALVCTTSLLVLATASDAASQVGICESDFFTIPNVIATPNGDIATVIRLDSPNGPLAGLTVELHYGSPGDGQACWCSGQIHPVLSEVTDSQGEARFYVRGGGCLDPEVLPPGGAVTVVVVGLGQCATRGQVSPDLLSTNPLRCEVTLADAVSFTGPLSTAEYGFCYDLNSDLVVGLTDAVLFTQSAAVAATCQR